MGTNSCHPVTIIAHRGLWRGEKAGTCLLLVFFSPPTTFPASFGFKETSVEGRELFNDIQVLKLFITLTYNVFPFLIMMLDTSKRRIKSPTSN